MQTNQYTLNSLEQDVYKFNEIAGKAATAPTKQQLLQQLALIQEELTETIAAVEADDQTETIDGLCDVLITAVGFKHMLDLQGYNTSEAMQATAENNLSKFIKLDGYSARETITESLIKYKTQNKITVVHNAKYDVVVLLDENNKVKKPVGFVSNDLSKFIPLV